CALPISIEPPHCPRGLSNESDSRANLLASPITGVMCKLVQKDVYFLYASAQTCNERGSCMNYGLQDSLTVPKARAWVTVRPCANTMRRTIRMHSRQGSRAGDRARIDNAHPNA